MDLEGASDADVAFFLERRNDLEMTAAGRRELDPVCLSSGEEVEFSGRRRSLVLKRCKARAAFDWRSDLWRLTRVGAAGVRGGVGRPGVGVVSLSLAKSHIRIGIAREGRTHTCDWTLSGVCWEG